MHEFSYMRIVVSAALALGVLLTGCGDPCKELAQKICSCEESPNDEQACLDRVEAESSNLDLTDAENNVCAEKLDTCKCNKLRAGDLAACGLALDND